MGGGGGGREVEVRGGSRSETQAAPQLPFHLGKRHVHRPATFIIHSEAAQLLLINAFFFFYTHTDTHQ